MDYDFENEMLRALRMHAEGKIAMAKATAQVYMNRPVGIGEHPQVMEELEKQMMEIAKYDDVLEMISKYFDDID
tara:strand:- start:3651 stop:3872 length:222 start_codon:yes stop_codon:yes gene_type:complete